MQYPRHVYRAEDALPDDEIDQLFKKLQEVQPPPSLIQCILTTVSKLPKPQPVEQHSDLDELDSLVVKKDRLPPS